MRASSIKAVAISLLMSASAHADNFCSAVVWWDSGSMYWWHRAEAPEPGYTNWNGEGVLKRSGDEVDDVDWSNSHEIHETQTSKINCNIYRAITTATFTGSGVSTELCSVSDAYNLQMGGNCH